MPDVPPEVLNWHWGAFFAAVFILLFLDLVVFHRKAHEPSLRESAGWTVFWIALALCFNGIVWWWLGPQAGLEYLTGYLMEKALSMDNVFVFAVVFGYFKVPLKYQYRVLFWGILGAVGMRLAFVLMGTALIHRFDWIIPLFGVFLVYTAVKLSMHDESEVNPDHNPLLRLARRLLPVAKGDHGDHFFAVENGRRCITPMFLVLLVVESTDVMFAVDSVPAIFAVVNKNAQYFSFIVFTSNVFAILGLRAMYFLLAGVIDMFRYLNYGLSAVLGFVGLKMIGDYVGHYYGYIEEGKHLVPVWASLLIIASCLAISILVSVIVQRRELKRAPKSPDPAKNV